MTDEPVSNTRTVTASQLLYGMALDYRQRAKKFKNQQYNERMADKLMNASRALQ